MVRQERRDHGRRDIQEETILWCFQDFVTVNIGQKRHPTLRNLSLFSTIMLVFIKHEKKLKGKPVYAFIIFAIFCYLYGKIKEFLPE